MLPWIRDIQHFPCIYGAVSEKSIYTHILQDYFPFESWGRSHSITLYTNQDNHEDFHVTIFWESNESYSNMVIDYDMGPPVLIWTNCNPIIDKKYVHC